MSINELLQMLKTDINSMTIGEKLTGGLVTTLLSISVVFVVLVIIAGIINIINAKPKENISKVETKANEDEVSIEVIEDDTEIVAAITAAIIQLTNKNIVVRRITRTNNIQSNWEKANNI